MISPSLSHDDNDSRWFLFLTVIVVFVSFLVYASAVLLCIFHIVVRLHTFWKEVCQYQLLPLLDSCLPRLSSIL